MKKKKKKKTWQKKATSVGVEGFVDWTNPGVSELRRLRYRALFPVLPRGCASERLALRERLPLALKHLAKNV